MSDEFDETVKEKVDAASMTDAEREQALLDAVPIRMTLSVPQVYTQEELRKTYFAPATSVHDIAGVVGGRSVSTLGWGPIFDEFTNGGLKKGSFILIGAKGAGYGKTGFMLQLGWDGFALRNDYIVKNRIVKEPLLPILLLSEMGADSIRCRSLGKLMRMPYEGFSSFPAAMKLFNVDEHGALVKFKEITNFIEREELNERMSPWQNYLNSTHLSEQGDEASKSFSIRVITSQMEEMKLRTEKEYPEWKGNVWPVLLIDPIQRFCGSSGSEVDSLSRFAEKLYECVRDLGWIAIATSDTTKGAATSKTETHGDAFRGSYKLMHSCDIAVKLEALPGHDKENPTPTIALKFDKNRSNVPGDIHFIWHRAIGLFTSENINQHEARKRAERNAAANVGATRTKPAGNGTWVNSSQTPEQLERDKDIDEKLGRVLKLVETPTDDDESEGF